MAWVGTRDWKRWPQACAEVVRGAAHPARRWKVGGSRGRGRRVGGAPGATGRATPGLRGQGDDRPGAGEDPASVSARWRASAPGGGPGSTPGCPLPLPALLGQEAWAAPGPRAGGWGAHTRALGSLSCSILSESVTAAPPQRGSLWGVHQAPSRAQGPISGGEVGRPSGQLAGLVTVSVSVPSQGPWQPSEGGVGRQEGTSGGGGPGPPGIWGQRGQAGGGGGVGGGRGGGLILRWAVIQESVGGQRVLGSMG